MKSLRDVREGIALGVGLLAAALIYVLLVQPSLWLYREHAAAQESRSAAEEELASAQQTLAKLKEQISRDRARLDELGGSPPPANEKDLMIARVTGLANASELTVDRYAPIDVADETDHRAVYVRFSGRGDYPAIQGYFRRFETEVDFMDITHFSIVAEPAGSPYTCQLTWSCRINALKPDVSNALAAPAPATPVEVALR